MKYINAAEILPDELLERLQNYIQGECLYIPIKKGGRKNWGELSGYRAEIDCRNNRICEAYISGLHGRGSWAHLYHVDLIPYNSSDKTSQIFGTTNRNSIKTFAGTLKSAGLNVTTSKLV